MSDANEFNPDYGNDPEVLNGALKDALESIGHLQLRLDAAEKLIKGADLVKLYAKIKRLEGALEKIAKMCNCVTSDIERRVRNSATAALAPECKCGGDCEHYSKLGCERWCVKYGKQATCNGSTDNCQKEGE